MEPSIGSMITRTPSPSKSTPPRSSLTAVKRAPSSRCSRSSSAQTMSPARASAHPGAEPRPAAAVQPLERGEDDVLRLGVDDQRRVAALAPLAGLANSLGGG